METVYIVTNVKDTIEGVYATRDGAISAIEELKAINGNDEKYFFNKYDVEE